MQAKNGLSNLYVADYPSGTLSVFRDKSNPPPGFYAEHLYIPAARLRELVEKWKHRPESCFEFCRSKEQCAIGLEALITEDAK